MEKCALATEAAQRTAEEGLDAFDCLGELSHLHAYQKIAQLQPKIFTMQPSFSNLKEED